MAPSCLTGCLHYNAGVSKGNASAYYDISEETLRADVRRAVARRGGKCVAVKTIRAPISVTTAWGGTQQLSDAEDKQFMSEVSIVLRCRHPNLVRTIEIYRGAQSIDIVIDLASGGEVLHALAHAERFSELEANRILKPICSALAYLHGKGVAHRNVKSASVLYAGEASKKVLLAEIGPAMLGMGPGKAQLADAHFMAPELFISQDRYCHISDAKAADVWALGVFAYLVLFGVLPFGNQVKASADHQQAVHGNLEFPPERKNYFPDAVDFVADCLKKDSRQRTTASAALEHSWWLPGRAGSATLSDFEGWRDNIRSFLGLLRQPCAEADLTAGKPYLVDNSALQAETVGLAFRRSKALIDKTPDGSIVPWGDKILGVDEQDGWLRIGSLYLPMTLQGKRVVVPTGMKAAAAGGMSAAAGEGVEVAAVGVVSAGPGDGVEVMASSTEWTGVKDADGDEAPEQHAADVFAARERRLTAGAEVLGEGPSGEKFENTPGRLALDVSAEREREPAVGAKVLRTSWDDQKAAATPEKKTGGAGAAALLRGLRSGEVAKIIDKGSLEETSLQVKDAFERGIRDGSLQKELPVRKERQTDSAADRVDGRGAGVYIAFDAAAERVSSNAVGSCIPKQLTQEQLQACAAQNEEIGAQLLDVISKLDTMLAQT